MRLALLSLAAALTVGSLAQAQAPAPAAPAAAGALSSASMVGDLLDNPAAKAVLLNIIPGVVNHPQINEARSMQLRELAQYAPELTAEIFAKIDAELAKIPKA
jgi:para-nitrobenzyl esterase